MPLLLINKQTNKLNKIKIRKSNEGMFSCIVLCLYVIFSTWTAIKDFVCPFFLLATYNSMKWISFVCTRSHTSRASSYKQTKCMTSKPKHLLECNLNCCWHIFGFRHWKTKHTKKHYEYLIIRPKVFCEFLGKFILECENIYSRKYFYGWERIQLMGKLFVKIMKK